MKRYLTLNLGILFLAMIAIISCTNKPNQQSVTTNGHKGSGMDTITDLNLMKGDSVIWSHHGMYTKVTNAVALDEEIEGKQYKTEATCSESFSGSARAAAKTSYATSTYSTYSTVATLRSALQTDSYMRGLGIGTSSARVSDENHNAIISTKYLYCIKRESDEDYHIIIGSSTTVSASTLLNCEVSGLPASTASSYSQIKAQRAVIKTYFGTDFCGVSSYKIFSPGIKLTTLTGSTFFDIDHAAGTIGPSGYQANTSWEIHPIHAIAF